MGWVKANIDVAYVAATSHNGVGAVFRDRAHALFWEDFVFLCHMLLLQRWLKPKALARMYACSFAIEKCFRF